MDSKIKTREEIENIVKKLKKQGKTIVTCNGCFDILHKGHEDYLKKARDLGDYLVVGLNSDDSVRRLKGEERPINDVGYRGEKLFNLEYVDFFSERLLR